VSNRRCIFGVTLSANLALAACSSSSPSTVTGADAGDNEAASSDDGGVGEAASAAACPDGVKTGSASGGTLTITVGGNTVNLIVRVPPSYVATEAHPFVMVFAPSSANASQNEQFTGLTPEAQKRGYIIAYADNSLFEQSQINDEIKESAAAIPAVTAQWCVDPKRVYMTGYSNGGTITETIAMKQWATLAAIAPAAAGLKVSVFQNFGCPSGPLPVMEMHSTGDLLFPIDAGFGADVAKQWATCDGCTPTPSAPDTDGCIHYTGCSQGVAVDYCQTTGVHGMWQGLDTQIFDFFDRFTAP
jgi:polyhydroxybutyrate depolymerase